MDMFMPKIEKSIWALLFCCSVSIVAGLTGCPAEFQEKCQCGDVPFGPENKMTYVTKCTNSGFDNVMMLQKLPPETEVLIFVGNEVRDLPLNIFSLNTTNENLHTIDLSNNKIQSVKGKTFHKVDNVKKLILNDNDIYIVLKDYHPRMFSNFINLEELHLRNAFTKKLKPEGYLNNLAGIFEDSALSNLKILDMGNNGISQLSHNEFCSIPSLEELYLSDNHLIDIPINFTCLTELKKLDLSSNNITRLPQQTITSLQKLSSYLSLNLSNNPFKCDCDMLETYKWMTETKIDLVNHETYRCSSHYQVNKGKHLFSVPKEEFLCPGERYDFSTTITHHIILAFGIIILIVVIAVLLHKNKQQVSLFAGRFIRPIRNKFQYVSLERRDNTPEV